MPDGYSRIFRPFVFGPSGFWTMATLQNLIPFFRPRPPPWRNPRNGRDQILPSGNTGGGAVSVSNNVRTPTSYENASCNFNTTPFHFDLRINEQLVFSFTVSLIRCLILKAFLLQHCYCASSIWKKSRSCTARERDKVILNM